MSELNPVRHGSLGGEAILSVTEGAVTSEANPAATSGLRDLTFDSNGVERLFYKFPKSVRVFKSMVADAPVNLFKFANVAIDFDFVINVNMIISEMDLATLTFNSQGDLDRVVPFSPNLAFAYSANGAFPRNATINLPTFWTMGNSGLTGFVAPTGKQFFGMEFRMAIETVPAGESINFPHWPQLKIIL